MSRVRLVTDRTNQCTAVALQKDRLILCARPIRRDRRIVMDVAAIVMLGSIVLYLLHQVESLTS